MRKGYKKFKATEGVLNHHIRRGVLMGVAFGAALFSAAISHAAARGPVGVYVVFWPSVEQLTQPEGSIAVANCSVAAGSLPIADQNLINNACGLLSNDAVSGLLVGIGWNALSPSEGVTNTQPLDDIFTAVTNWNAHHTRFKTIQLGVGPGFSTPSWFFSSKGVKSCDGLFTSPQQPTVANDCDFTTIFYQNEVGNPKQLPFPLPWSARYKAAWSSFLSVLNSTYGTNPALVTMQVTGPTSTSEEMILPNDRNETTNGGILTLMPSVLNGFGAATVSASLDATHAWNSLIKNHYGKTSPYIGTNQPFIIEWEAAIDLFDSTFSGITLSVSTGLGFPFLATPGFPLECGASTFWDCADQMTVVEYLATTGLGTNTRSSQMDGLSAVMGTTAWPKELSGATINGSPSLSTVLPGISYATRVIAGLQFSWSPTLDPATEGCTVAWSGTSACEFTANGEIPWSCASPDDIIPAACVQPGATLSPDSTNPALVDPADLLTPEQGLYNVLAITFANTIEGAAYGQTLGTEPLNYLQVWPQDIRYAVANSAKKVPIVTFPGGTLPGVVSVQQELAQANWLLSQTAQAIWAPPGKGIIPPPCPSGGAICIF